MSEPKRPDSKRRSPAARPGRAGDLTGGRPRKSRRRGRDESRPLPVPVIAPLRGPSTESAEQRLGFTARRAAILAVVVCVLTLTIAGPVRTYFAQRTEMHQLASSEAALRQQIADLKQQKARLADPVYIAAQARERLGFVRPGDVPYQVQLPPTADVPPRPGSEPPAPASGDPWYTALWHTIADAPHGPPAQPPPEPAPAPPAPVAPGG